MISSKYLVLSIKLIIIFALTLNTYYLIPTTVSAFFVSNHACPGTTQQRQCTCEKLAGDDFCDLSDSRTLCGECLEPTALPPLPPASSDLPVTSGNTPSTTTPSTISPSTSSTLQSPVSNLPTKEEAAVYRVNQGTMPKEVIKQPEPSVTSFFGSLLQKATELLSFTNLFVSAPNNRARYYAESETLHQSQFPEEVREKKSDIVETLKGYIGVGSSAGIYSTCTPAIEGVPQDIKSYEALCQKGSFPEGIYPIVDPTPTPLPF